MPSIPDYTDNELDAVRALFKQCYKEEIEVHLADAEVRLDPGSAELSECPAAYWYDRQCNFVIVKTDAREFRCQFFCDPNHQYATGHPHYNSLEECVAVLLHVQSDREREHESVTSASTGSEIH